MKELSLPNRLPRDPLLLVRRWLAAVQAAEIQQNFNALTLATVGVDGIPSARVVLLKEVADPGYGVFYTHYHSRKAQEIEATGVAAGVMHWDPLGRQIRFEGPVVRSPTTESDHYFASRSWRSQLNAMASQQSQPLTSHRQLLQHAKRIARDHGVDVSDENLTGSLFPRPPEWGGYRFWFRAIEFWVSGVDRFHHRVRYQRSLKLHDSGKARVGGWQKHRLQP